MFHSQENSVSRFAGFAVHETPSIHDRLGVVHRVGVGQLQIQVVKVGSRPPLDDGRLRADRVGVVVQPDVAVGAVLKAGRFDHQRVAIPAPDRVAKIARVLLRIPCPSVQPHPAMPAQCVERAEPLGCVQDLERKHTRQEARNARDDAARFRIHGLIIERQHLFTLRGVGQGKVAPVFAKIAVRLSGLVQQLPVAGEERLPVGAAWRLLWWSVVWPSEQNLSGGTSGVLPRCNRLAAST